MARVDSADFHSGDLIIRPETGQVTGPQGETVRLGPVNMKVLKALLNRPGEVVSRGEVFHFVWGNQVVSEDALTRCVSDIRAVLRKLSGRDDLIETLPKRGYRWTERVREAAGAEHSGSGQSSGAAASPDRMLPSMSQGSHRRRLIGLAIAYLLALIAMASLIVWAIDRFGGPGPVVVAVLPTAADPTQRALAAELDAALTDFLIRLDNVELLSRSAVDSRPPNPFPYFYFEFGARWLVETVLQDANAQQYLSIEIVDARTGIVLLQAREPIDGKSGAPEQLTQRIAAFFASEIDR